MVLGPESRAVATSVSVRAEFSAHQVYVRGGFGHLGVCDQQQLREPMPSGHQLHSGIIPCAH